MKMRKQFTKRILSLVLVFVMVIGMIPLGMQKVYASYEYNEDYLFKFEIKDLVCTYDGEEHSWGTYGSDLDDATLTKLEDSKFQFRYRAALAARQGEGNETWWSDYKTVTFDEIDCVSDYSKIFEFTESTQIGNSTTTWTYTLEISRDGSAGHVWGSLSNKGNGTHSETCAICGETKTVDHTFKGANCITVGKCDCGAVSANDSSVHAYDVKCSVNSADEFKHDSVYECCGLTETMVDHTYNSFGLCTACQYQCSHATYTEGKCNVCGYKCPHASLENNYCQDCEFGGIPYINRYWNETTKTVVEVTGLAPLSTKEVTSSTTTMSDGWYIVKGDISTSTIKVEGTVHLILADGATLTCSDYGLTVKEGNTIYIYAQSSESGKLIARVYSNMSRAGIGAYADEIVGTIVINGGIVKATGGPNGAGIGSGNKGSQGSITINGGIVEATGGSYGAGIGSGNKGSQGSITINGGIVEAIGGSYGAGIGSGNKGSQDSITINGGTVTATGGYGSAGIGMGSGGSQGSIAINGGNIKASSITGSSIKDSNGNNVSLSTITLDGAAAGAKVTSVTGFTYGLNDVNTLDTNKLYFYLPANAVATSITAGDIDYICKDSNLIYYTSHDWSNHDGICARCGDTCGHENQTGSTCDICGTALHTHHWEYAASGTKITATCMADGCPNEDGGSVTVVAPANLTYDGTEKEATLTFDNWQLGDDAKPIINYNETDRTAVTNKDIVAAITLGGETVSITYQVKAVSISDAAVTADNVNYTGNAQTPDVTVVLNGKSLTKDTDYTVSYTNNTNVGSATVTVTGIGNYEGTATKNFAINQKEIGISWGATAFLSYTGQPVLPTVTATYLADGDSCDVLVSVVESVDGAGVNPGQWTARITGLSNENYKLLENSNVPFEVKYTIYAEQAAPNVSGVAETIKGKKDGHISGLTTEMEYSTEYTKLNDAYTKVTDQDRNFEPGTYYVRYAAKDYYYASPLTEVTVAEGRELTVTLPATENQVGYTITADKTTLPYEDTVKITINAKEGCVRNESFTIYNNGVDITDGFDFATNTVTLTGVIEDVNITIADGSFTDIANPTAEITVGTNKWNSFLNTITFGLFFKDTQDVTITANDIGSGVGSVQYYLADGDLSKTELNAISDWMAYTDTFKINPNNKHVIYVKVADKAGNVIYVNSDGIVLYTDSTLDTTEKDKITYVLTKNAEQSFTLNLNGNTVDYVKIGNTLLGNGDFEVLGNTVVISDEVLEALTAGEYTVTVGINPMGETFVAGDVPSEVTIPLVVEKAVVDIDIAALSKIYDGTSVSAKYEIRKSSDSSSAASDISYNEKVEYKVYGEEDSTYSEEAPVNAGEYTVRVSVSGTDKITSATETADFIIIKDNYNMRGAKWNYTVPFQYDGKEHKVEVVGLPAGVTVESYENNTATAVGDYYAEANLAYDVINYNAPGIPKLGWTIYNDWTPTEYTVSAPNGNGWLNKDFVITANDGYKVSINNTAEGEWINSLIYSEETTNGSVTFYLKNETDGTISLAKTVTYKLDKTMPTGKVEFVERTGWEKFVNTIIFGLFYKDEVTVKVTTNDNLSGVAKIEYASADKEMTLDEVKALTDWMEYTDSFGVTLEDAKKFVYFVRITDKAGNVTYLSTDGAEYDIMTPVISGIEDGKTYYTTQKVTVTEKNIDGITLNGEIAGNEITLEGNKEATYTITATDKAGNEITVTVTMKPIKELTKATENLGNDNVTSADAPALKELVEKLDELIADPDTSDDGERETLEQHKHIAESLIETIDDTKAEIARINEELNKYDDAIVNSDDAAALEQLSKDIKTLTDGNNLTDDERTALTENANDVVAMQKLVSDTVAENDRISDAAVSYDLATVTSDDEEDLEQLLTDIEKQLESTNLTEDEKKALEDTKAKAENLLDAIEDAAKALNTENIEKVKDIASENVTPEDKTDLEKAKADLEKAIEDNGGNYTEDEKKAIEDEIKRIDDALEVIGNVEAVEELIDKLSENITKNDEDAIKVVDDTYNALSDYEKSLVDEDAKKALANAKAALAKLNKPADSNSPATGDTSSLWLWIALLFVSGAGIFGITRFDRKRKM